MRTQAAFPRGSDPHCLSTALRGGQLEESSCCGDGHSDDIRSIFDVPGAVLSSEQRGGPQGLPG